MLNKGVNPQELVNKYAGSGRQANNIAVGNPGSKEIVAADRVIGKYYDRVNGKYVDTKNFTIVYSKKGVHIYPARP